MKKILLCSLFFLSSLFAQKVEINFFWQNGCRHCEKEKEFLQKLEKTNPNVKIYSYEASKNSELLDKFCKDLKITLTGLPLTIIGDEYFIGFYDEESTGAQIERAIKDQNAVLSSINVPFFGKIELKDFSLPMITLILGGIDGFNPCAMWVLVMLLSFLIALKDKKKVIILGSFFIFISALVYWFFMEAWLNIVQFFSYIIWVRISIGIIALIAGYTYLKDFFKTDNACSVTNAEYRKKIAQKVKFLTEKKQLIIALIGIAILAFLVNLIELVCSLGLPVVYIQILNLNTLSFFQYHGYILLYIFIFMLDDILVFLIAIFSFRLMNITNKYSKICRLVGGAALIMIGFLLIFKPQYLTFG